MSSTQFSLSIFQKWTRFSLPVLFFLQIEPTTVPTPKYHTEVPAKEPEIITAPFSLDDINIDDATTKNSSTPLVITKKNMKNFNLNESLVLFNVADDKKSDLEFSKYRITKTNYNDPYYITSTGKRQSRLGNMYTLLSSSMLVKER